MRFACTLLLVGCGGLGSPSPSLTVSPPPSSSYVSSPFAYCVENESDSGKPGVNLPQNMVQPGEGMIGSCPAYLLLPELSFDLAQGNPASLPPRTQLYYLDTFDEKGCVYANPRIASANWTTCIRATK
jgi:hypothetical protein